MTTAQPRLAPLALLLALLAGCGGGGGGAPPPTEATVTLSVGGLPAGTALSGAVLRLRFPPGVTPRQAAGAVRLAPPLSDATAQLLPPHWSAADRRLTVGVASKAPAGLAGPALLLVDCDATAAAAATAYEVESFTAADLQVRPLAAATLQVAPAYR